MLYDDPLRLYLRPLVELVMAPALLVRDGTQQLAYLYATGERPDCPDEVQLTSALAVEDDLDDDTRRFVRVSPLIAVGTIATFAGFYYMTYTAGPLWVSRSALGTPTGATFVGPQTPVGVAAALYLLVQYAFLSLWDPLVVAVRGWSG